LLPAVLLAACAREWVRDYDGILPGTDDEDGIHATLVVDARTRAPLPGATLRLYREQIEPFATVAPFVAEFRADRHGIIVVPWEERFFSCHWVYDHPGYAAQDEYAYIPDLVELVRGRDVRGRIVGAPEGVEVEYFVGCPHSPAVRRAVTDGAGRFVIRDADPEDGTLWAVMRNRVATYLNPAVSPRPWPEWEPLDPPWGVNANGRVVDEHGEPVPGVVVYSEQTMRGPRTVTDEKGYFRLDGLESDAEVHFHAPDGRAIETMWGRDGVFPGARDEPEPPLRRIVVTPPGDPGKYEFWLGYDEWFEAGPDGRVVIETTRAGPLRLSVSHEEYGYADLVVGETTTRVGPDAFPAPGTLVVLGPDDRPAELLDEDPVSTAWCFRKGAYVSLQREDEDCVPVTRVLEGQSPFTVRLGGAELELRVTGVENIACCLDGELVYSGGEDTLPLRGLDAGPHLLLVGARGCRSKELRVVLAPGEARRVELALDPR